jgi:hypothetical protein
MSIYNKVTNSVADAVSKIMNEKLHPNQQKLDVHEPEKDKLTAHDFKKLRAKKEMETGIKREIAADRLEQKAKKKMEEESEQIQEYTSVGGKYVHRQKEVKDAEAGVTDWDKEEKMAKDADKPATKKRAYGAHQNRRTNTKLYKEMIESLKTGGIKSLFKTIEEGKIELNEDNLDSIAKKHGMELKKTTYGAGMKHPTHGEVSINRYGEWNHYPAGSKSSKAHGNSTDNFVSLDKHLSSLKEEASQEEFTKEMQDQKAKFDGKKKTADIAKPSVQAVQQEAKLNEGITVKKEYDDKKEAEHGVYHNGKKIGYIVHNKKQDTHTAYHSPQGDPEDQDYGQIDDFHQHHAAVSQIRHSAGVSPKEMHEATHNEIQVIDMTDGSQKPVINIVDLEEKSLTEPEMKKKEEVVKSMKKGIAGFKERYGDRAKSVMYATATRIAKDKA